MEVLMNTAETVRSNEQTNNDCTNLKSFQIQDM